jgi:hypothetical protein
MDRSVSFSNSLIVWASRKRASKVLYICVDNKRKRE